MAKPTDPATRASRKTTPEADEAGEAERNSLSAAAELKELSPAEKAAVEQQGHANAALIHETIRAEGEAELKRTETALVLRLRGGPLDGLFDGRAGRLQSQLPDAPWRPLVSSFG